MALPMNFHASNPEEFKMKALQWASSFERACYFDSNGYADPYSTFDTFIGAGAESELISNTNSFQELADYLKKQVSYTPGFLTYDLKNQLENLSSSNVDYIQFPDLYFFVPEYIITIKGKAVTIKAGAPEQIWQEINNTIVPSLNQTSTKFKISSRFEKSEYIQAVTKIQEHIKRGDIYEMNFCQEFYIERCTADPLNLFMQLNIKSPVPFACYFKIGAKHILSASPERFLSRRGNKLISQPIKGTRARSSDPIIDAKEITSLQNDEKEKAENVMIVDLVRNDLTKSAVPGSVRVEELFGIYSFSQVHQLISTVVCSVDDQISNPAIIANTFPMGSMTGAPKISAMKIAEKYERTKRGVYSGAVGYFGPDGNFDFNVVIRTILFDTSTGYLSFQTGGAITIDSVPEQEYEECLLKAKAINEILGN